MNTQEFYNQFVSRKEIFAQQLDNGTYLPVRREITLQDIADHFSGKASYGIYCVGSANNVKWGVIDSDKGEQKEKMIKTFEHLKEKGYDVKFEESGSEGHTHIWVMKEMKFDAMRILLLEAAYKFGLQEGRDRRPSSKGESELQKAKRESENSKNIEIFPKNKEPLTSDQVGFLVKLPLGFNKKAQKWSKFVEG